MKTFFKRLLFALLGVVTALVLLVGAVLVWPQILINNTTLKIARWYLGSKKIVALSWEEANLGAKSQSLWVKQVTLVSPEACYATFADEVTVPHAPPPDVHGCVRGLDLAIVFDVRKGIPKTIESLPNSISLAIQSTTSRAGGLDIDGHAFLTYANPTALKADVQANLGADHKVSLRADSTGTEKEGMQFIADATYEGKVEGALPRRVSAHLEGVKRLHGLEADFKAVALNLADAVKRLETHDCHLKVDSKPPTDFAKLGCPIKMDLRLPDPVENPITKYIKPVGVRVIADLKRDRGQKEQPVSGNVGIEIDSLLSAINEGRAALSTDVSGLLSEFPDKWNFDVKGSVDIDQFQKIVTLLRRTPAEIPAPFNVLQGGVSLQVDGKGKVPVKDSVFNFTLGTKLRSRTQRLIVDAKGELALREEGKSIVPHLASDVTLSNVGLVLPAIEFRNPPSIVPDSRFVTTREINSDPNPQPSFRYDVKITTPNSQPITLTTTLSEARIPIFVNMVFKEEQPATGSVKIAEFPLKLLRRDAKVEYFQLIAASVKTETEIKGKINFYYTDYTISLYIDGLMDRPRTRIMSDPPLPEKQALAVLLFGRPIEQLDADQMDSVGNTTAALTDGAITLASMYALASTPVESVGYDPSSRLFSARLRLGDGTSMDLKTDSSRLRQLGIRKRLGPHLGLRSYLEDPFEATSRSLTTLLEWSFLY